jgi:hypothetical protein
MFIVALRSNERGAARHDTEKTPLRLLLRVFVFTELLPGNAFIQSFILLLCAGFEISVAQQF